MQMDVFSEAMQGSRILAWKGHDRIKLFHKMEPNENFMSQNELSRSSAKWSQA